MSAVLETKTGVLLDLPRFNRMVKAESLLDGGPGESAICISVVWGGRSEQAALLVSPETTVRQIAQCLIALSGKDYYSTSEVRDGGGCRLEPSVRLRQLHVVDGARFFGVML